MIKQLSNEKVAIRVSIVTIVVNIALAIFKLAAGIVAHSSSMVSDAVHSASDVFSTFVVIIGVKMSNKKSDRDHQYGHERLECVSAIILSIVLAATGVGIGISGLERILAGHYHIIEAPGVLALIAAVISIVVKEVMYWYTRNAGKKIVSGALIADAWHHRSDAFSSIGSFVGILGSRMGFVILDSVASVIICLFIVKISADIFLDATGKMTDKACDKNTTDAIKKVIEKQSDVIRIDVLKTRLFANKIYVDVEISVDSNISLEKSHDIAHTVHDSIEREFFNVKHCMVHVNPFNISNK